MKMIKLIVFLTYLFFCFGNAGASELLDEAVNSFVLVMEDVHNEMGSPEMTNKVAEQMERLVFMRDSYKKPAFQPKVNVSWSAYKDSITAIISGEENVEPVKVRVLWRPGQELEILDPDAVLEW